MSIVTFLNSKVQGANMGPTWVLSAPDWPHVGPMSLAIWVVTHIVHGQGIKATGKLTLSHIINRYMYHVYLCVSSYVLFCVQHQILYQMLMFKSNITFSIFTCAVSKYGSYHVLPWQINLTYIYLPEYITSAFSKEPKYTVHLLLATGF